MCVSLYNTCEIRNHLSDLLLTFLAIIVVLCSAYLSHGLFEILDGQVFTTFYSTRCASLVNETSSYPRHAHEITTQPTESLPP